MQLRYFVVRRKIQILLVEEWRGVQPIGAAMRTYGLAVKHICSGGRAHVDVRPLVEPLLRIVHRGIDAKFLHGLRAATGEPHRSPDRPRPCAWMGAALVLAALRDASIIHDAGGGHPLVLCR
jgi:hypothetical protein